MTNPTAQLPSIFLENTEVHIGHTKNFYLVVYNGRVDRVTMEVANTMMVRVGFDRTDSSIIFKLVPRPIPIINIDVEPGLFHDDPPVAPRRRQSAPEGPIRWLDIVNL